MSGVNTGSQTQIQRGKRKDYYGMNGVVRPLDPMTLMHFCHDNILWQLDRLQEMNPDPAGGGICASIRTYALSAAKGLMITILHICSNSRAGLTSNVAIPASSKHITSWIKDSIGSNNLPVDTLESLGAILAEYVRPCQRNTDIESFEVCTFPIDAACDTNPNTILRMNAILQDDGNGGVLANAVSPIAAVASYKKFVQFKLNDLGIQPVAAPTCAFNNGWNLCRAVADGNRHNILAGCSTENYLSDSDMLKIVLLEPFNAVGNFVPVYGNYNQSPFQQAEVRWQRASQRIATTSLLHADNDILRLIRGPTLTMWPVPFNNPVGAVIAGAAPGGGLLPAPIGPLAPLGHAPAIPAAAPAPGGVDPNVALQALLAIPGVAAALAKAPPPVPAKAGAPVPAPEAAAADPVLPAVLPKAA